MAIIWEWGRSCKEKGSKDGGKAQIELTDGMEVEGMASALKLFTFPLVLCLNQAVTNACKKYGGFYLGSIGGPAAILAQNCIKKVGFPYL